MTITINTINKYNTINKNLFTSDLIHEIKIEWLIYGQFSDFATSKNKNNVIIREIFLILSD
jgi:hypothetical protein